MSDPSTDLDDLRKAVASASEHTQRQLTSIDGSLLLKSLFSVLISLGVSYVLKIAILWIPVSLLIIPLWSAYGLITLLKRFTKKHVSEAIENQRKLGDKVTNYRSSWMYDNIGPMIKALSMIYIGTFFVFIGIEAQIIQINYEIPKLVPIITVVLFGSIPLYYDDLTKYIEQNMSHGLDLDISKLSASKLFIGCFVIIIGMAFTPGILFGLPIWSLVLIRSIYYPFTAEIWLAFLVAFLQLITIAMFCSYFSSLSARKELVNTLTNMADIDYQISMLNLSKDVKAESVMELTKSFMSAKKYELSVNNMLLFFPFYELAISKAHVKQL